MKLTEGIQRSGANTFTEHLLEYNEKERNVSNIIFFRIAVF